MWNIPLLSVLLISLLPTGFLTATVKQKFVVKTSQPVAKEDTLYLAGNNTALGDWNPNAIALNRKSDTLFEVVVELENAENIEFKITRGSWETVEKDAEGGEIENRTATVKSGKDIVIEVESWADQPITPGQTRNHSFPGIGEVKRIHEGFVFTEGPAYDGKHLYFTDIPNNRIMRTDLKGNLETFLEPSGKCNGLMIDGKGKLLACRMGNLEEPKMEPAVIAIDVATKKVTTVTDRFEEIRYNACNDLVIDKTGGIYFTDPRYNAPQPWPQKVEGVYYRSKSGKVQRLEQELVAPNGIILSPDESVLYVCPSMQKEVHAYTVKSPPTKDNAGGDGMSIDVEGNIYLTTDLGIQIVSPAGKLLGIIALPEHPANCAFGGPGLKTLFATCRTGLYAVDMPISGLKPVGTLD
jgi:gluconolactonase